MQIFKKLLQGKLIGGVYLWVLAGSAFAQTSPALQEKLLEYQQQKYQTPTRNENTAHRNRFFNNNPSPLIVGGKPTTLSEWPFIVALIDKGQDPSNAQFCGGSLIQENVVLTAAHCVYSRKANSLDIYLGSNSLSDPGATGEIIAVDKNQSAPKL